MSLPVVKPGILETILHMRSNEFVLGLAQEMQAQNPLLFDACFQFAQHYGCHIWDESGEEIEVEMDETHSSQILWSMLVVWKALNNQAECDELGV